MKIGNHWMLVAFFFFANSVIAQQPKTAASPLIPVHTFSIVARDPATGEMGVAVQSHWFNVGSMVTWAEAGVGAIATQSFTDLSYGPLGLDLMRAGKSAPEALKGLLAKDNLRELRQVAMIDAKGRVVAWTGKNCISEAGHQVGINYSTQANIMEKATVWPEMAKAFEAAKGDLTDRLLAALEAAQRQGGDIRGQQSAAILVVSGKNTGQPWNDRLVDLRVEDSKQPIAELRRLVQINRAYQHVKASNNCSLTKNWSCAEREIIAAEKLMPDQIEFLFWHAVILVRSGKIEKALPLFKKVFTREPKWAELVRRLPKFGLLPNDPKLIAKIQAQK